MSGNSTTGAVQTDTPNPTPSASPARTGVLASLLVPEVWNPHDESANSTVGTPRPTSFRFVADSTDPINLASAESVPTPNPTPSAFAQFGVTSQANISSATTAFAAYNPTTGSPLYSMN